MGRTVLGARREYRPLVGANKLRRVQPGLSVQEMAAFQVLCEREGLGMAAVARRIIVDRLRELELLPAAGRGE